MGLEAMIKVAMYLNVFAITLQTYANILYCMYEFKDIKERIMAR